MKNIEQELKMALTEREYNILLNVGQVKPQLHTNYYFRYRGMPKDMMIRLRKKGDEYLLCYKHRLSDRNGVSVSDERECEVSADFAQSLCARGVTRQEAQQLLGVDVPNNVPLAGSMDTYRAKFKIDDWLVELDKNVYSGRVDYELECENLFVEQLEKLKNYLFYAYGIVFRPSKPKVQRFLEAYLT